MAYKMKYKKGKGFPFKADSHLKVAYDIKTGKFDEEDKTLIDDAAARAKYKHKDVDEGDAAALEAAEKKKAQIVQQEKERQLNRSVSPEDQATWSDEERAKQMESFHRDDAEPEDYQANIDKGAARITDRYKDKHDTWHLDEDWEEESKYYE